MMIIGKNNFHKWRLLLKILNKELPEDDSTFQEWLVEDIENKGLYQILKGDIKTENLSFDKDKVFSNLSEILDFKLSNKVPFYKKKWFSYVASFLITLSVGMAGFLVLNNDSSDKISEIEPLKNNTDQNSRKAFLFSSQGETIDLAETFEIEKEDGTIISNTNKGIIRFEQSKSKKKKVEYHRLDIPKGGEYELFLSDGSKVYLNSETQLVFPDYFEDDIRQVELIGEAYFEIKKDNKPFVVKTADMQIRVLGTSFNVNAYQDINYVNTALIEGSIEVNLSNNPDTFLIEPENNFSFNKISNEISIEKVDTDIHTAWIKGELIFRNETLEDIFLKLSRWYEFTIMYEDSTIKFLRFTGSARKEKPLDYLLDLIQSVTDIKYRKEEDKIILY